MGDPTGFFFGMMVIAIIIIGACAYIDIWAKKQKKIIANMMPKTDVDLLRQNYTQEIEDLKSRVETLEKIVTDKTYTLKKQFDELDAA